MLAGKLPVAPGGRGVGAKKEPGPREADPARKINPAATYSRPEGLPSAGTGLTTVFGMGTGVAPSGKPPENPEAPVRRPVFDCQSLRRPSVRAEA